MKRGGGWTDIIPADHTGKLSLGNSGPPVRRKSDFCWGDGGFALAAYTGRWRNTKDIDFYILPEDREATIKALSSRDFVDYYNQRPYDPGWIYRGVRDDVIVDIIWSMANRRSRVDEQWFERSRRVKIRGRKVSNSCAPEELSFGASFYIFATGSLRLAGYL